METSSLFPILAHYPVVAETWPGHIPLQSADDGLINQTHLLGDRYVLQWVNPIFGPDVNDDILALTTHLSRAGFPVPEIIKNRAGKTCTIQDGVWRLMTFLPGRTYHQLQSPEQARSAGALVARFHTLLLDLKYRFKFSRGPFHDTPAHLKTLKEVLETHRSHRLYREVAPIAEEILRRAEKLPAFELPQRICHGDLKVSNLRFSAEDDSATGVLDMDTMAYGTLDAELGDALRSWCNLTREDASVPDWNMTFFTAAMTGYLEGAKMWLEFEEWLAISAGTYRIILELSARFAADALVENYFGFDPNIAPTRGAHNLIRARNQLSLARIVEENQGVMTETLHSMWRGLEGTPVNSEA